MTLISIILALIAERSIGVLPQYRQFDWLFNASEWVKKQSPALNGPVGAAAILIIAGIVIELTYRSFLDWFALAGLAFSTAILIACLGPKNFYDQIKHLCEAVAGKNEESACWYLENIKDYPLTEEEKKNIERTALESLFVVANDRMLGVILWFALLGPLGAVIYRLASVMHFKDNGEDERSELSQSFDRLYFYINWPSSRLVALSYAVVGNWLDSVAHLKQPVTPGTNWPDSNAQLLANVGRSSLSLDKNDSGQFSKKDISNGLALVRRSVAFWVGVIALLTLAGWLG